MQTGILADPCYMNHDMGAYHVESPERIEAILEMIKQEITFPYLKIEPRLASNQEIQWVHDPDYVQAIQSTAGKPLTILDPDTSTSALSYETALQAAGGGLQALDHIMSGEIKNAFAAVRPPGHHAEAGRAMGFCLFNNIAIGAEHLIRNHGLQRILIIDWDLHHGNGTQNSFYDRKDVLYLSTHQFPHYPGTGHWRETGNRDGEGFTINLPLSFGKGDEDYAFIFQNILFPIANKFQPEFILVSAGFDIADSDPLGGMQITPEGFGALTALLMDLAQDLCQDRLFLILEGGYDINALQQGIKNVLMQLSLSAPKPDIKTQPTQSCIHEIEPVQQHLRQFWTL